jgi:tRNA (cmo5U34)-methyltransferase
MPNQDAPIVFNQECASSYDKQREKLSPIKDALHLFMRMALADLPDNARILCVGAGTGAELIDLAKAHPNWQFTAVDPAGPMLEICRQSAKDNGIESRCSFHEGYLESLPASEPFSGATSILVSHFFTDRDQRRGYFREIASRLVPGGTFVNADLSSDMSGPDYKSLFEVWIRSLEYSGIPNAEVHKFRASFGQQVAVLPPKEVESMIASSGFCSPVLFFQAVFIHAWFARRSV